MHFDSNGSDALLDNDTLYRNSHLYKIVVFDLNLRRSQAWKDAQITNWFLNETESIVPIV